MKKILLSVVALFLVTALSIDIDAGDYTIRDMSTIDALVVGTSAVAETTTAHRIEGFDYVGASVHFDVTSGGGAGAGTLVFQGRVDDTAIWTDLWIVNLSDSFDVAMTVAFSGTADIVRDCFITYAPIDVKTGGYTEDFHIVNPYPYTDIRMIVNDTNWNAACTVTGKWIGKRKP